MLRTTAKIMRATPSREPRRMASTRMPTRWGMFSAIGFERDAPNGTRLETALAIVMGDLNTWEPNAGTRTTKVFTNAGLKTPFGSQTTFRRRFLLVPIELHLDWVWFRGLETSRYGVDRQIDISDHWPLWAIVKIPPAAIKK